MAHYFIWTSFKYSENRIEQKKQNVQTCQFV